MGTEKRRAFVINFIYWLVIGVLIFALLKYILPILAPFVAAFVIAYLLRRPTKFLSRKLKWKQKRVALILVLFFYLTIGTLVFLLILKIFTWIQQLIGLLPELYGTYVAPVLSDTFLEIEEDVFRVDKSLFEMIDGLDDQVMQSLGSMVSGLSVRVMSLASNVATSIPGLFIRLVLMVISTFFLAADMDTMKAFCVQQMSDKSRKVMSQIKEYLIGTLLVCIRSYLIIMCITFVELSIAFTIIGLDYGILWAGLIAVFDILPVLGTGGVMIPWMVITVIQGNYPLALALLITYIVVTIVRNIVEPKIVGRQLGLHPVITLASMFLGVALMGGIGLFGLPIALSLLCYLNDNGTIHIFKKTKEKETT